MFTVYQFVQEFFSMRCSEKDVCFSNPKSLKHPRPTWTECCWETTRWFGELGGVLPIFSWGDFGDQKVAQGMKNGEERDENDGEWNIFSFELAKIWLGYKTASPEVGAWIMIDFPWSPFQLNFQAITSKCRPRFF